MADDLDTFDPVRGPARELIDATELALPADRAAVIFDRRRRRPRYFDGRFLTARDLTREQQYTLLRQADLAQLSGAGVVHGLEVTTDATGTQLFVSSGLGVAASGESVTVREQIAIVVSKLRVVSQALGSRTLVAEDATSAAKTGLFVLTAFPVEHARTPGLAFPTGSVDPKLADTEIVESTWFALVPVPNVDSNEITGQGRARLAREVFVGGFDPGSLSDGLAVALLGVAGGRVQWIDRPMVVRRVGGDAVLNLGLQRRKLRLAFEEQYAAHLADEIERRRTSGLPDGMAASEAFQALPPVGPLPRGAVQVTTAEVRQSFFPREIYVEMAVVPEDELPALLSEGLARAPIDLKVPPEALEGVPVLIVIPVPRAGYDQQTGRMQGSYRGPKVAATGRPLARVRPIDALAVLRTKNEVPVVADPVPLDLESWRKAVESAPQLWYVRRQQFSTTSVIIPRTLASPGGPDPIDSLASSVARGRLVTAAEAQRFNRLFLSAVPEVIAEMNTLLGTQLTGTAAESSVLVSGIMGELAYVARRRAPGPSTAAVPTSPVFSQTPRMHDVAPRPLQVTDVQRVATRFAAQHVAGSFRDTALRAPAVRSVLSTSAVVPELAFWAQTPDGIAAGGITQIAALAGTASVSQLRALASTITLTPALSMAPPTDSSSSGVLTAIRNVGHPEFLTALERTLSLEKLGDQPLFSSWLLMRTLVVGYELPVRNDGEAAALLDAVAVVDAGARKFVAPNGNGGEILAAEQHATRDKLVQLAAKASPDQVALAQQRWVEAGFDPADVKSDKGISALRLLALASTNTLAHLERLADARPAQLKTFAEAANKAAESRSLEAMKRALRLIATTPAPKKTPR